MKLNIKSGTRPDVRLCDSCQNSVISKGPQQGQEIIRCTAGVGDAVRIPFAVVECNGYSKKGEMQDYEAKRIGWVLEVKAGRVVGFKPPHKKEHDD